MGMGSLSSSRAKQITNNLLKFNMISSLRSRFHFPVFLFALHCQLNCKVSPPPLKLGFSSGGRPGNQSVSKSNHVHFNEKCQLSRAFKSFEYFAHRGGPQKLLKINAAHLSENVNWLENKWWAWPNSGRAGGLGIERDRTLFSELKARKHFRLMRPIKDLVLWTDLLLAGEIKSFCKLHLVMAARPKSFMSPPPFFWPCAPVYPLPSGDSFSCGTNNIEPNESEIENLRTCRRMVDAHLGH